MNIASTAQFFNSVQKAEQELGGGTLWYRGVPNFTYKLLPSLLRYSNGASKERDLYDRYFLLSGRFSPRAGPDWEILSDMQHYGIPTRLLDWTEVMGIAIFFSLLGHRPQAEPAIYILNPLLLNNSSKRDRVIMLGDEQDFSYKRLYLDGRPSPPSSPVAAEARFLNDRIQAQRGKYTIHGNDIRPLEEQFPDCVKKVMIPNAALNGVRAQLQAYGISEFSVFPDLVGLAPHLAKIVGIL